MNFIDVDTFLIVKEGRILRRMGWPSALRYQDIVAFLSCSRHPDPVEPTEPVRLSTSEDPMSHAARNIGSEARAKVVALESERLNLEGGGDPGLKSAQRADRLKTINIVLPLLAATVARAETFRPFIQDRRQCPNCWVRFGDEVDLSPPDNGNAWDCSICGNKFVIG